MYFVGNFEGRSVHVNDFSTYVQNSAEREKKKKDSVKDEKA